MPAAPRFAGLTAAPFTPFRPDGELALDRIPALADALVADGVVGAFVCGTTGEGSSLTTAERKAVAAAWVRAGAGRRLRVTVHAGHASVAEAKDLARHAADVGAAAVSVTAPYYFRPGTAADLVPFLADVAAAAPGLPFYYYDIPSTTHVFVPAAEVLRRTADRAPNLAGVKFSNPDLLSMQECVALDGGRFEVLFGVDEFLLAGLVLGSTGAVGSTYNYAAAVYHRMLAAVQSGDLETARREQQLGARLVRALIDFGGGVRAGKAVMAMLGLDCGPVRQPLRPLGRDEAAGLFERLRELDVFGGRLRPPV
jgi:N-acetylneuraminate lyase